METKFWITLIMTLYVECMFAQTSFEQGNKIDLKVIASVELNAGIFSFNYKLRNDTTAKQAVWKFTIITAGKINLYEASAPVNWEVIRFLEDTTVIKWLAEPEDEIGGYKQALLPGKSLSALLIKTTSLPGIVLYYAEGDHPLPKFEPGMATDSIPGYSDLTPYGPGVVGKTIGPVLPPAPFLPLAFLDTLISYKHQAFDLGWIKNQGIIQSLDAKLENAKRQLQRNNTTAAKNILQAFVNEVEALWKQESPPYGGTQITSEAYALLKFNAEYLISKL